MELRVYIPLRFILQLDQENTALAKVANPEPDDINLGIEEIADKLKLLKTSLREACDTYSSSVDYNGEQLKLHSQ